MRKKQIISWLNALAWLILVSLIFTGCDDEAGVIESFDDSPPSIVSMEPADGATNIPLEGSLVITFSEPMSTTTVLTNTGDNQCSGTVMVSADGFNTCVRMSSDSPYAGGGNKIFHFEPMTQLQGGTTYQVRVSSAVKDTSLNGLTGTYTTTTGFTTEFALQVIPSDGSTNVAADTSISVTFPQSINTMTVNVNSIDTICSGSVQISADDFMTCLQMKPIDPLDSFYNDNKSFSVTPAFSLNYQTTYKVKITTDVQYMDGNPIEGEYLSSFGFTTQSQFIVQATLYFTDNNFSSGSIYGSAEADVSADGSIKEYKLFWGNSPTSKLGVGAEIVTYPAASVGSHISHYVNYVPSGATYLLLYAVNYNGETSDPISTQIYDLVIEVIADVNSGGSSFPEDLIVVGDSIFFSADDGVTYGRELWEYDITTDTLTSRSDINSGVGSSNPQHITLLNGKLYFSATDGGAATYGNELWEYNIATPTITNRSDIYAGPANDSNPASLTVLNGKLYFSATDGPANRELWEYDGVTTVTNRSNINVGGDSYPEYLTVFNGKLFFSATDAGAYGNELWEYDGVTTITNRSDIWSGGSDAMPQFLTVFDGDLYFAAYDGGTFGTELWSSDGTAAPFRETDINSGTMSSNPDNLIVYGGNLLFSADDGMSAKQMWIYNGIDQPYKPQDDSMSSGGYSSFSGDLHAVVANDGALYYLKPSPDGGLYIYEGTYPPYRLANVNPSSGKRLIATHNGSLYFNCNIGSQGTELCVMYFQLPPP